MGASFSPSLANLYMGWWEKISLYAASNPHNASILWYGRYVDDHLLILGSERSLLMDFLTFLNVNNLNLSFTMHFDPLTINFLDVALF